MTNWRTRYLDLAAVVASWSRDPSTKVGAVIVRPDKTIASVGYNGFPRQMRDTPERYADREEKYSRIIHAEVNALLHARESVTGYDMYVWPYMPVLCANRAGRYSPSRGIDVPY
jgi:dCMP deaminase